MRRCRRAGTSSSGYCGQISLGHALYFGLGAYTTALLFTKFGVLPWFGMLGGGADLGCSSRWRSAIPASACAGITSSSPPSSSPRSRCCCSRTGIGPAPRSASIFPCAATAGSSSSSPRSKLPYFYFALALACVAWFVTWWLEDSKWGYWWRAVKDNPDAAESLGVVVFNSKMGAAAVSAFLVAVGGSFYAQFVSYIDPESVMGFQFSLLMALPAVLGGIGTLWGPVLGAVILIPLTELTRSFIGGSGRGVDLIVYGTLIVLISLARPQGLVGLFSPSARRRRDDGALLETRGVWQRFGGLIANSDVSISVGRGEIVGLIGPNGAGKSTLFNLIAGVLPPTQGSIWFDGEDVTALPAAERCQRGIGRTFQVVKSFETMTVIDNVIVGALVRTTVMREARRKAHEVLEFCGLAARADVLASDLVPSEKRRLEVARALATEPKLLLLDEVLTGLTPVEAQDRRRTGAQGARPPASPC